MFSKELMIEIDQTTVKMLDAMYNLINCESFKEDKSFLPAIACMTLFIKNLETNFLHQGMDVTFQALISDIMRMDEQIKNHGSYQVRKKSKENNDKITPIFAK